jgi:acyl carrier protein
MNMSTGEVIREDLVRILGEVKKSDVRAKLEHDDNFMRSLNMDSLDAVELIGRLGREFGFEFGAEADDLDALESLTALTALVVRRTAA